MNAMNKLYTSLLAVAVIFLGIIALRPVPAVQKAVQTFGATAGEITYWISGDFSDDLNVQDDLTVGGDATVTGAVSVTGNVSGANIPNTAIVTMTSATTTPCAVANTSGATRTIVAIGATERGTATSVGAITVVAGTSTSAYGTTHYTNFVDTAITKVSGVDVITTTSTPVSTYEPWRNGEYIVFSSNTTTHSGTCRILYY